MKETKEEEVKRWVRNARKNEREEETEREESSKALQRRGGNTAGEEADSSSLTRSRTCARETLPSYKDTERHLQVARGGEVGSCLMHLMCVNEHI